MAWLKNRDRDVTWEDIGGEIGGFDRINSASGVRTLIGPIYSPNGTAHWIQVTDAGVLETTTTDPRIPT